ncbi:MAG: peptidoglycan recognition protein family protein [Clostridiales bacterium]|nr:peptidoglycan recognition protein family protein [Clostridiales bacterium]
MKYSSDTQQVRVSPMGKVTIAKEFIGTAEITVTSTETEPAETLTVKVTVPAPKIGEQELCQAYMTENPRYKENRTLRVKGLMLHSVNCPQPSAMAFIERWNDPEYVRASIHAFIDADTGVVYQSLPWTTRANHCWKGPKGCGNDFYIGVEMCESPNINWLDRDTIECYDDAEAGEAVARTYASAVELFAMLCVRFDLDPLEDGVVISHHEGFERGIASDHGDPENLWKAMGTDYTMDGFRKDVSQAMKKYE